MSNSIRQALLMGLAAVCATPALVRAQSSLRLSAGLGVYAPLSDLGASDRPA